jgi:hypothetical protein
MSCEKRKEKPNLVESSAATEQSHRTEIASLGLIGWTPLPKDGLVLCQAKIPANSSKDKST